MSTVLKETFLNALRERVNPNSEAEKTETAHGKKSQDEIDQFYLSDPEITAHALTEDMLRRKKTQVNTQELFGALRRNPQALENETLYDTVRECLWLKTFDHVPLTADEEAVLIRIPELDEDRVIRVSVTDELIDRAAEHPETLTNDEAHALEVVLLDKIIDGEPMSEYMIRVHDFLNEESDVSIRVETDAYDLAMLEYGYDIHNVNAVTKHIISNRSRNLPISVRERQIIMREHGIDPDTVELEH